MIWLNYKLYNRQWFEIWLKGCCYLPVLEIDTRIQNICKQGVSMSFTACWNGIVMNPILLAFYLFF